MLANSQLEMLGIHAHIGSQIFEVNGFVMADQKLVDLAADWQKKFNFETRVLNIGGGFGIQYTKEDDPLAPEEFVDAIVKAVQKQVTLRQLKMPAIWIEPGRSIAGPADIAYIQLAQEKKYPAFAHM